MTSNSYTNFEELLLLFEFWERSSTAFLIDRGINPDDVEQYIEDNKCTPENFPQSMSGCIQGVSILRKVIYEMKQEMPENISLEVASWFAYNIFTAGIFMGKASPGRGMEVFEPLAKTRFAQIMNQPKARNRKNVEQDDIEVQLDAYVQEKRMVPPSLDRFLRYLADCGYIIDCENSTVSPPVCSEVKWRKPRAFGTIDNWRRAFNKNIRLDNMFTNS